eukprot:PhF_6_TR40960/c0_g1_i1/m.61998
MSSPQDGSATISFWERNKTSMAPKVPKFSQPTDGETVNPEYFRVHDTRTFDSELRASIKAHPTVLTKNRMYAATLWGFGLLGLYYEFRNYYFYAPAQKYTMIPSDDPQDVWKIGYPMTPMVDTVPTGECRHQQFLGSARGVPFNKRFGRDGVRGYDTVVVGGGFGGLHTALRLIEGGQRVLVVEKERVGGSVAAMGLGILSANNAQEYGVLASIAQIVKQYKISCDLHDKDAVKECKPVHVKGATIMTTFEPISRKENQHDCLALNPTAYCLGLARVIESSGRGDICESSYAIDVKPITTPPKSANPNLAEYRHIVRIKSGTTEGVVKAKHIVWATPTVPWWVSFTHAFSTYQQYIRCLTCEKISEEDVTKLSQLPKPVSDAVIHDSDHSAWTRALLYVDKGDSKPSYKFMSFGLRTRYSPPSQSSTQKHVLQNLRDTLPLLSIQLKASDAWCGAVPTTLSGKPIVGCLPSVPSQQQSNNNINNDTRMNSNIWLSAAHPTLTSATLHGMRIADSILSSEPKQEEQGQKVGEITANWLSPVIGSYGIRHFVFPSAKGIYNLIFSKTS